MIARGGEHPVKAQLGAHHTVVTEAKQERALQSSNEQPFNLGAVGARHGESRHGAHRSGAFARQVESRDANRRTVAPHAHQ